MDTSIFKANVGFDNIIVSKLGVKFSDSVSIEDWENFGEKIGQIVNSTQFIIGDWLIYGRARWQNRSEYAKRMKIAETNTGLDKITLKCYASVARKIPFENRNLNCSFCHHIAVAKLSPPEQSKWLNIASREKMSVRNLKASIKEGKVVSSKVNPIPKTLHTFDDCFIFVHGIQRWFFRKRNNGSLEKMSVHNLSFHRDKLKSVVDIYNELNAMIQNKH